AWETPRHRSTRVPLRGRRSYPQQPDAAAARLPAGVGGARAGSLSLQGAARRERLGRRLGGWRLPLPPLPQHLSRGPLRGRRRGAHNLRRFRGRDARGGGGRRGGHPGRRGALQGELRRRF
ncbi:MAG: Cupin domain-containing protein, partial [uncultured Rubrobacteraceae bacterium]